MMALLLVTVIAINPNPAAGEIGATEFGGTKGAQVWIDLQLHDESGPAPAVLNLTATFPGRRLSGAPETLTVRVQTSCLAFPTTLRQPVLRIYLDSGAGRDLFASQQPSQFAGDCDSASSSSVSIEAPFATVERISRAHEVRVEALGLPMLRLSEAELTALRAFLQKIGDGVTLK